MSPPRVKITAIIQKSWSSWSRSTTVSYTHLDVYKRQTENTFRPERVKQIAEGFDLDVDEVLSKIHIARAFNSAHQILMADKVNELIQKDVNIRLVIVDSLTSHFRAEYVGRESLATRQQKLNQHLHTLQNIACLLYTSRCV